MPKIELQALPQDVRNMLQGYLANLERRTGKQQLLRTLYSSGSNGTLYVRATIQTPTGYRRAWLYDAARSLVSSVDVERAKSLTRSI